MTTATKQPPRTPQKAQTAADKVQAAEAQERAVQASIDALRRDIDELDASIQARVRLAVREHVKYADEMKDRTELDALRRELKQTEDRQRAIGEWLPELRQDAAGEKADRVTVELERKATRARELFATFCNGYAEMRDAFYELDALAGEFDAANAERQRLLNTLPRKGKPLTAWPCDQMKTRQFMRGLMAQYGGRTVENTDAHELRDILK